MINIIIRMKSFDGCMIKIMINATSWRTGSNIEVTLNVHCCLQEFGRAHEIAEATKKVAGLFLLIIQIPLRSLMLPIHKILPTQLPKSLIFL